MTKNEYDVILILKGKVKAYSPAEIEDNIDEYADEMCDALFGTKLPHYFSINDGELSGSTGLARKELEDRLAYELYWFDRKIRLKVVSKLHSISTQFEEGSGFVFKDPKAIKAAIDLKEYSALLKSSILIPKDYNNGSWSWSPPHKSYFSEVDQILSSEQRAFYQNMSQELLGQTLLLWQANLIIPDALISKMVKK
jgi:hypothetical protein